MKSRKKPVSGNRNGLFAFHVGLICKTAVTALISHDVCYDALCSERTIRSHSAWYRNYCRNRRSSHIHGHNRNKSGCCECGIRSLYSLLRCRPQPNRRNRRSSRRNDYNRNKPDRHGCDILFPCSPLMYITGIFLLQNLPDCDVREPIREQRIIRQVKCRPPRIKIIS